MKFSETDESDVIGAPDNSYKNYKQNWKAISKLILNKDFDTLRRILRKINGQIFKKLNIHHREKMKDAHFNDEKYAKEHNKLAVNLGNLQNIKLGMQNITTKNGEFAQFTKHLRSEVNPPSNTKKINDKPVMIIQNIQILDAENDQWRKSPNRKRSSMHPNKSTCVDFDQIKLIPKENLIQQIKHKKRESLLKTRNYIMRGASKRSSIKLT